MRPTVHFMIFFLGNNYAAVNYKNDIFFTSIWVLCHMFNKNSSQKIFP